MSPQPRKFVARGNTFRHAGRFAEIPTRPAGPSISATSQPVAAACIPSFEEIIASPLVFKRTITARQAATKSCARPSGAIAGVTLLVKQSTDLPHQPLGFSRRFILTLNCTKHLPVGFSRNGFGKLLSWPCGELIVALSHCRFFLSESAVLQRRRSHGIAAPFAGDLFRAHQWSGSLKGCLSQFPSLVFP